MTRRTEPKRGRRLEKAVVLGWGTLYHDLHAVYGARDIFDTNGAFLLTEAFDSSSVPIAVTESPSRAPGMATAGGEANRRGAVAPDPAVRASPLGRGRGRVVQVRVLRAGTHADRLSDTLRSLARFTTSAPSLHERPIRRVAPEVSRNLEQALALARKCKPHNILRRVVTMTSAANFRKIPSLLDTSIEDLKWLLSVFDTEGEGGDNVFSVPPIASNDPVLALVWSSIASLHMGPLPVRIDAANALASLARDNDRYKMIIVEEGGVPPLLKLLNE
ncbi:hypothetical protein ACJRO7_014671, partial [Eucalyptus globulus]